MKSKYTMTWFKRFFYPIIDLDNGKPDDPAKRAQQCMRYFVRPLIEETKENMRGSFDKAPAGTPLVSITEAARLLNRNPETLT